jgi:hypothetical protein
MRYKLNSGQLKQVIAIALYLVALKIVWGLLLP